MPNADPTSLDNLHDIVSAPPVPFWPPAPGWYVVAGCMLALALWGGWTFWRRWKADAYRRAALAKLQGLQARAGNANQRGQSIIDLATLLKRTALAAFPREQVASLTGDEWLRFLDHTGGNDSFSRGAGRLVAEVPYNPRASEKVDAQTASQLFETATHWIRDHVTLKGERPA